MRTEVLERRVRPSRLIMVCYNTPPGPSPRGSTCSLIFASERSYQLEWKSTSARRSHLKLAENRMTEVVILIIEFPLCVVTLRM